MDKPTAELWIEIKEYVSSKDYVSAALRTFRINVSEEIDMQRADVVKKLAELMDHNGKAIKPESLSSDSDRFHLQIIRITAADEENGDIEVLRMIKDLLKNLVSS